MLTTTLHEIMSKIKPKVLILGAGVAGIAAASKLIKHGFTDLTILEAENRIGGRIHSVPFEGVLVDLGAQWVHGEDDNIIYQMVKDMDLLGHNTSSDYHNVTFFRSDNAILNNQLANRVYEIASEIIGHKTANFEHYESMEEYFKDNYDTLVSSEFGNDTNMKELKEMVEDWISKVTLCYEAAESWNQVSVKSLVAYQQCEGDPLLHWKHRGYSTLLDVLMTQGLNKSQQHLLENSIILNKEVNCINWEQNLEQVKQISVKCTDGSTYDADHIVVTLSVGVLKHHHDTLFHPKLPEYKINCIESIPLGITHKILLKFPKKWWPDNILDFSFLWTKDDRRKILEEFPHGPVYNGRSWLEYLFGFYTVDSHPELLLGWVVGPMTKDVEELPDELVQDASMFLLRKFVGKKFDIPEPVNIMRSKWGINPHFYGTYSYLSTEMVKRGATHDDLAKPLSVNSEEVVLFAGEATHNKYFSTVHGAIESGYREANRLIQQYRNLEHHKIVVVGAGMAGLGAATQLIENNVNDFLILEAQNQPGGRIQTVYIDDRPIDLGAQWLHGKSNLLYELATKNDLLSDDMSEEGVGQYVRSNNEIVDPFIVSKIDFEIGKILEKCAKFINSKDYPNSLGEFLDNSFNEYLKDQNIDSDHLEVFEELYDWHVRFQVVDNSCKGLSRLSAKSWGEYVCEDDFAHYNFKFGYGSLVQVIIDKLPKDCISYDSEVTEINLVDDKKIKLGLQNGRIIVCDHLILTPSLGVLKEFPGLSQILPDTVMRSIENMGFHGICKIYLFYAERWWGETHGFQLLWTKDCNFSEKHSWLRQVTGFDEVFNHPNALMTWVGGDAVQEVESLQTEDIGKRCTALLQKFLPSYTVPVPNKVIRTKWLSNPFVKGSYCHITPECDESNSDIRTLGEPVIVDGVPRIILAGEAIHPSHYSTTHGAYESGYDQARILIEYISKAAQN